MGYKELHKVHWLQILMSSALDILSGFSDNLYARVKVHLEPTHLKYSHLFTFSRKSLGQDLKSVHFFFCINWVKIHRRQK